MSKINIEIVVPERTFFQDEIDSLVVGTSAGELGIFAGHAPMVIALHPSIIVMKKGDEELVAANGEGFITVYPDKMTMLCQTMEWPYEINLERVNKEIEKGKKMMETAKDKIEYDHGATTLQRAYARLAVLQRKNEEKVEY